MRASGHGNHLAPGPRNAPRGLLGALALALALVLGASSPASADGKPIIAVFNITVQGRTRIAKQVLGSLADYLATQLTAGGRYQVVPRDQLATRLRQQKKRSYKKCFKQSCQIAIGRELAANKSLATKVMKIGKLCVISATVYDLRTSTSESAATARGKCTEEALLRSVDSVARTLSGESSTPVAKTGPKSDSPLAAIAKVSGIAVRWPPACPAQKPATCLAMAHKVKEPDQGLLLALYAHGRARNLARWPVAGSAAAFVRRLLKGYVPRQTQLEALLVSACRRRKASACAAEARINYVTQDRPKLLSFLRRACDLNDLAACTDLAEIYKRDRARPQNQSKAISLYRRACGRKFWPACTVLAGAHIYGRGVPKNERKGIALYRRACDHRYWKACQRLGFYYSSHKPKNYAKSEALYRQACDGGHAGSCSSLAFMYKLGLGVRRDPEKAQAIYQRACRSGLIFACLASRNPAEAARLRQKKCSDGDLYACNSLAVMYDRGTGVPKDTAKARALYRRSCDLGNISGCRAIHDDRKIVSLLRQGCTGGSMYSCVRLGNAYRYGRGVRLDKVMAVKYFRQACDRNDNGGCLNLAKMYSLGAGVPRDLARARAIYLRLCQKGVRFACRQANNNNNAERIAALQRSCVARNTSDCYTLATKYRFGSGVRLNKALAALYYGRACNGGHMRGCADLAYLYKYGYGVRRSLAQSQFYYRKACSGGYRSACLSLSRCPSGSTRDRYGRCVRSRIVPALSSPPSESGFRSPPSEGSVSSTARGRCPRGTVWNFRLRRCVRTRAHRCRAGWRYDYLRRRCVLIRARRGLRRSR